MKSQEQDWVIDSLAINQRGPMTISKKKYDVLSKTLDCFPQTDSEALLLLTIAPT